MKYRIVEEKCGDESWFYIEAKGIFTLFFFWVKLKIWLHDNSVWLYGAIPTRYSTFRSAENYFYKITSSSERIVRKESHPSIKKKIITMQDKYTALQKQVEDFQVILSSINKEIEN